jgi:tight adherence protein C
MTPGLLAAGAGLFLLPLMIGGGLLFNRLRDDRRLAGRFAALHRPAHALTVAAEAAPSKNLCTVAVGVIFVVGDWALRCGLLSDRTRNDLEATLRGAGHSGTATLRQFVGAKIVLLLALPPAAWLATNGLDLEFFPRMIATAGGAVFGMLAPDMIVRQLRGSYVKRVENELPDALDLMVICAQAGLGLATTIIRVAQELQHSHRAVALELAHTANELQMTTDTKIPLVNFGNRCGVDSARRLAATLLQSAQYGTPLTEALRGLAAELRVESITRFEARAARMPVFLTMPMIAFILPTLFMVVGGPAAVQVIHALH